MVLVLETIIRWRCSKCNYVTFNKPKSGDCTNCEHLVEINNDEFVSKHVKKRRRRKVKNE